MASVVKTLPKAEAGLTQRLAFDHTQQLAHGCDWVVGVDEVGRGSWVGPVVTAAVCFTPQWLANPPMPLGVLATLNDSKQLKPNRRQLLATELPNVAWCCVAQATQAEVEGLNVHHASLLGLRRAVAALLATRHAQGRLTGHGLVLVDGKFPLPRLDLLAQAYGITLTQQAVVKGDGLSACIAGASVVAKTHRDGLLAEWASDYPHYGWERNAGYGTPQHRHGLQQWGNTPLHRRTFLKPYASALI
jgi:ribonuclease HII